MTYSKDEAREIMVEHYFNPVNKGEVKGDNFFEVEGEGCSDSIKIELSVNDSKIDDAVFESKACSISTSSTDILLTLIKGKSIDEVKKIISNYTNMIDDKEFSKELLGDLNIFGELKNKQKRRACALLGPKGILEILG